MKYLIRALKYLVYFAIIFFLIVGIVFLFSNQKAAGLSLVDLFKEGSLPKIALFFVAWKAPAWVRETGLLALAAGWLWTLFEFMAMAKAIQEYALEPTEDAYIIWGAVPCALIPAAYGTIVYIISLIIRIVRKPKI